MTVGFNFTIYDTPPATELPDGEQPQTTNFITLASSLQEGFNATQIGWSNINWSIFPARPGWPDFTVTNDINSINVFLPIPAETSPEFLPLLDENGEQVTETVTVSETDGVTVTEERPVFQTDAFGNPIRIVDSANDLFLAIGGTVGNDHLRNRDYTFPDGNAQERLITGAFMGFSGDDVLYSENVSTPMLMGGSGDDSYILENKPLGDLGVFSLIVENGNDNNDSVISYNNDWAYAMDINGQHLLLADASQTDVIVIWNFNVPEARIENFAFDFNNDGFNELYTYDAFNAFIKNSDMWLGSFQPEELGLSRTTVSDLTQSIAEAVNLSNIVESTRIADESVVLEIARLYQASFDRSPDVGGLNFWIDSWETQNLSLLRIAENFVNSNEFLTTYGELSNRDYVSQLYLNVLDRTPDNSGFEFWLGALENNTTRSEVLYSFSDSLENKINTEGQLSNLTEVSAGVWDLL